MNEYNVLLDDGEEAVIVAASAYEAYWDALERGLKPVDVEALS